MDGEAARQPGHRQPHIEAMGRPRNRRRLPYCTPAWMLAWWKHPASRRSPAAGGRHDGRRGARGHRPVLRGPRARRRTHPAAGVADLAPHPAAGRQRPRGRRGRGARRGARRRSSGNRRLRRCGGRQPLAGLLTGAWPGGVARAVVSRRPWARPTSPSRASTSTRGSPRAARASAARCGARRSLEEQGATVRLASTPTEIEQDIGAFIRLHHARWDPRGGSDALDEGVERMLHEVAPGSSPPGRRLRLASVATADRTVAVKVISRRAARRVTGSVASTTTGREAMRPSSPCWPRWRTPSRARTSASTSAAGRRTTSSVSRTDRNSSSGRASCRAARGACSIGRCSPSRAAARSRGDV